MTSAQLLSFVVIAVMMIAFVWGRIRYDLVAAGALIVSVALGIVPVDKAFSGFSDDIVIIVASALVVSAAVARSGVMEVAISRFAPNLSRPRSQLILLVGVVTILSAFIKNIGALAIMMPIAFQMASRSGVSPSMFLMPMSFGALLGGLMTQIGTSPNIIVSRLRVELTGQSFSMFDFTPVGALLAVVGVLFLIVCYKLLPERRRENASIQEAVAINNYTTEARVPDNSPSIDKTLADLQKLGGGRLMVTSLLDVNGRKRTPFPDAVLRAGDILIIEGEPEALDKAVARGGLTLSHSRQESIQDEARTETVEAVVGVNSPLIGNTARELLLFDMSGVNLLAISRRQTRFTQRLGTIRFEDGDVILLRGPKGKLPELLQEWGCLPLVERGLRLGSFRDGLTPIVILLTAMAATALGIVTVPVAFFTAALLMVVSGALPLREVYARLDASILVMLAALIPVSESLQTTGATELIGTWLSGVAAVLPPYGALALILVAAMAVTPFLNNAATVLVMAPIAATFAAGLGLRPEPFLMAVAIGAGCDFLTPIGHQCNTLVMGPGGYRFGDYWRLGLPLSVLVVLTAVPALMLVWPP
ncbi:permease [Youhaiella tibetensis]|uniref:SLC13 family permease n=2 Tax=Paradevosia tibetensis TaxID=1447062 RepID=A0A5B9DLH5_9HYPH|nr:SLC13 family permease [Youhaiella tibetensis]QEE20017.1 SLC13 family permease [Youhaiella tibetensis]GGF27836.1 permease [Youhaiella tibetensis]